MKNICLVIAFISCSIASFGQWTESVTQIGQDINCVQRLSDTRFYAVSRNNFLSTTNGGASWSMAPMKGPTGVNLIGDIILDIHFFDNNIGVATGWTLTGNSEVIYRTTNGGLNWTYAHLETPNGVWPFQLDEFDFPTASIGYAVGNNGRILKTTNGGVSWAAQNSGVTWHLYSVDFVNSNLGIAVGENGILRTTNGGASWQQILNEPALLETVAMIDVNTGYAFSDAKFFYTTTNGGVTWQKKDIPFQETEDIVTFNSLELLALTRYGAYKSNTGGAYWEYYQVPGEYAMFEADFSGDKGIVVGSGGKAWTVDSKGGGGWPVANFSIQSQPAIPCPDQPYTFQNLSDPALSFKWIHEGQEIGTSYHLTYAFPQPGGTKAIGLVATNGVNSDTAIQYIILEYLPELPAILNVSTTNGIACPFAPTYISFYSFYPDITYQLFQNQVPVGPQQTSGFVGTTSLFIPYPKPSDQFSIMATRTNNCGVNSAFYSFQLPMHPVPDLSFPFTVSDQSICAGEVIDFHVDRSEIGKRYILRGTDFSPNTTMEGSGQAITFEDIAPLDTTLVKLLVLDIQTGCLSEHPTALKVDVQPKPGAYFSTETVNPEPGQPISIINDSDDFGGTYHWQLSSQTGVQLQGSNPTAFTLNMPGVYPITLTINTAAGCSDTLVRTLRVPNPVLIDSCNGTHYSRNMDGNGTPSWSRADAQGNSFVMLASDIASQWFMHSGRNDSIIGDYGEIFESSIHHLIKLDKNGTPLWFTDIEYSSAGVTAVTTDQNGNIYIAMLTDDSDNIEVSSRSGRKHKLGLGEFYYHVVLLKYDAQGNYQWARNQPDVYYTAKVDIEIAFDGSVYLMGNTFLAKYSPIGELLWSNQQLTDIHYLDIEHDHDSTLFLAQAAINENHEVTGWIDKVSLDGTKSLFFGPVAFVPTFGIRSGLLIENMRIDQNGDLYITGAANATVIIANQTFAQTCSFDFLDPIVARLDPSGQVKWVRRLNMCGTIATSKGLDVKDDEVGVFLMYYGDSLQIGNQLITHYPTSGQVVWTLSTNGFDKNLTLINNTDAICNFWATADLFHYLPNGDSRFVFSFNETLDFGSTVFEPTQWPDPPLCNIMFCHGSPGYCFDMTTVATHNPHENLPTGSILFPNPTKRSIVSINLPHETIEGVRIFDLHGKLMETNTASGQKVDARFLNTGLYFVEIRTSSKIFVDRLVVEDQP
jgi:photosystem II stability/assembly factor-like uncharacterized protein